ncbi:MAG: hypothetical protein WC757_01590 [Candidatus Paceibacterota bacterium]|jgi:hypothetical protein
MKKTFYFIIIFILVVILAFTIYSFFTYDNKQGISSIGTSLQQFFPFGTEVTTPSTPTTTQTRPDEPELTPLEIPILRHITLTPIGGATLINSPKSTTTIRYIDRGTGHIYETAIDASANTKITNATIPKIQETVWINDNTVIARFLDTDNETIRSFLGVIGSLPKNKTSSEDTGIIPLRTFTGSFLPTNIPQIVVSPNKTSYFNLSTSADGTIGLVTSLKTNAKTQIFVSPLREWLAQWTQDSIIVLTMKASAFENGYAYTINPTTGVQKKIVDGKKGLTTLASPSTPLTIAYSESKDRGVLFSVFDPKINKQTSISKPTLSEKCVWETSTSLVCAIPKEIPSAIYPDAWYQGTASFTDDLMRINASTGTTSLIADLTKLPGGQEIDVINLILSDKKDYLLFTNKKDLTLWGIDLKRAQAI